MHITFSTYMSEAWNECNFFGSSEKSFIPGMLSLSVGGSENTSWVLSNLVPRVLSYSSPPGEE